MPVRISAPAKLNRFLGVLGRRADGFHDLEMVSTVLEEVPGLTDVLEGDEEEAFSFEVAGTAAGGVPADGSNLVVKAWRLLEAEAHRPLLARLRLEKRIPHGAGLGGGSSDAAAALRLGNILFDLGLAPSRLLELAAALGSDVPLFLLGGTVLGLGKGERVQPLRPIPLEPIVLAHPRLHVATPSVYRALASVGYPMSHPLPSLPEGQAPPWRNDLAGAAVFVCPALGELREALQGAGGEPLLCGSGSCWAARFPSPGDRDLALDSLLAAHPGWGFWAVG